MLDVLLGDFFTTGNVVKFGVEFVGTLEHMRSCSCGLL